MILDIGCGTGRHAVELAKRGYDVTAFDISEAQLRGARSKVQAAGVRVRFIRSDARAFRFRRRFDLAIMICEGAFPLMETDEENVRIFENAARALAPGGKLILTTLNALFPPARSLDQGFHERPRPEERSEQLRPDDLPRPVRPRIQGRRGIRNARRRGQSGGIGRSIPGGGFAAEVGADGSNRDLKVLGSLIGHQEGDTQSSVCINVNIGNPYVVSFRLPDELDLTNIGAI